jgi:ubiquinone/menaquinone biosynthesis C-methylase UbiE
MKSNQDWIQWGRRDPLYGVAAWPGHERGGPQAWTDKEFYELGRSDWADFIDRWVAYGVDTSSCVEIGSGAGRLTKYIARTFDDVYAVDVSAEMLDYAKRNINAKNVTFALTNGWDLPLDAESVTAAFSAHVFQHFDSLNDGTRYFTELARVLANEGSLMIHLPVHAFPFDGTRFSSWVRMLYSIRKKVGHMRAAALRRLARNKPFMRRLSYEMAWTSDLLRRLGFTDVEFVIFSVKSNDSLHSFVFARKGSRMALASG